MFGVRVKRRGILLAVGLLTLATVSLAATVQLLYFQLPDPEVADGPGLIRWMVLRDFKQESPEVRRKLLVRVQQVLIGKPRTSDKTIDEQLDPKYRPQFWSNVDMLLAEWFYQQAEIYAATPADKRTAQLDQILDSAKTLGDFKPSTSAGTTAQPKPKSPDPLAAATEFMQKIQTWIAAAPPEKQPALRHFAAALQARMAARTLQGFMKAFGG